MTKMTRPLEEQGIWGELQSVSILQPRDTIKVGGSQQIDLRSFIPTEVERRNYVIDPNVIDSKEIKMATDEVIDKTVSNFNKAVEFIVGTKIRPELVKNGLATLGAIYLGNKAKNNMKNIAIGLSIWMAYKNRDKFLG